MSILVTVCARGGSKGLRNKNILPVGGLPLIAHTIGQARAWGRAARIVCSTDSPDIAAAARAAGAETPFVRPADLAGDAVGKVPVIRHALAECEKDGARYDTVVDLDATSPLRTPGDIQGCVDVLRRTGSEVAFSVVPARRSPYFNMVERGPDGVPVICKKLPGSVLRRQDAPKVYDLNASIYAYDAAALRESRFPGVLQARFDFHEMPEESAFDVDSELDLAIVELIMRRRGWIP